MSEMIERVARAICGSRFLNGGDDTDDGFSGAPRELQEQYRGEARAAIAAMREPTNEQYEALSDTGKMWREINSEIVWKTYIDAALGEKVHV